MTETKLPNFFLVGVEKAGTTAVYEFLKEHPEIYLPNIKEPAFFYPQWENRPIKTWDEYYELFAASNHEIAIGDTSPQYFNLVSAKAIKDYVPDSKIIVILRQPVERAYSHYMMHVNSGKIDGQEFTSVFRELSDCLALKSGEGEIPFWGLAVSFYYKTLSYYYELFDQNRIRVYLYEDLRANPNQILKDMFDFLKVDASFTPDLKREVNKGKGMPRNQYLHYLLKRKNFIKTISRKVIPDGFRSKITQSLVSLNATKKNHLSSKICQEFLPIFIEDIYSVEKLLDRDLSIWYQ